MEVSFTRTGERRYAVTITAPGRGSRVMDPAPGYDDHIPHDLVHYVIEAELKLTDGVYGRVAQGGGSFLTMTEDGAGKRERARLQRKQRRRESALQRRDAEGRREMIAAERLAMLCDVAWRRRHGQQPSPALWKPDEPTSAEDAALIERIVPRLDRLASAWGALPVGGKLTFVWPETDPAPART